MGECPASPISPTEGDMLQAKVVVAKVDSVAAEAREMVNFYLQASTVGMRVVVLQLSYMVGESKCQNTQMVELTVMQPFSFTTTFLTEALDETMQANTDEVFCICCSVTNLSPHSQAPHHVNLLPLPASQVHR